MYIFRKVQLPFILFELCVFRINIYYQCDIFHDENKNFTFVLKREFLKLGFVKAINILKIFSLIPLSPYPNNCVGDRKVKEIGFLF